MCKPTLTELQIACDGPCGWRIKRFSSACAAFSLSSTWREGFATVLRRWADNVEGTNSFFLTPYGPPSVTFEDSLASITHGVNGANKYLNDIWRERCVGEEGAVVQMIQPVRPVK